jgi:hypothetical protein
MPDLKIMGTYKIPEPDGTVTEWRIRRQSKKFLGNMLWRLERFRDRLKGEEWEVIISGLSRDRAEILDRALRAATEQGE